MTESYINSLTKRVVNLCADANFTASVDCSEIADFIKQKLKIGSICTIRAFGYNEKGMVFSIMEPQGKSESYFYHTVLQHVHNGVVYIIDGTNANKVMTLQAYINHLKLINAARQIMFVFFKGYVGDYSLKELTQYKQKILYTVR